MTNTVIQEWTDEKGWIHRMEIPLNTFLIEHDLEPVVRCKDCKYFNGNMKFCDYSCQVRDDDYCSWGEREDEVEE